jgi:alpha-beta hydrolase superfamily lysophospholipase
MTVMRRLVAALTLLAAGCAAGGPMPAPDIEAPPVGLAIADSRGAPLALSLWPAEGAPRAIMLALHGFGDHAESTFSGPAPFWAAAGVSVYAYDQHGFGNNADRGVWPGAERLIDDLAAVAARLHARHPDLPLYVLGHSMGAGVVLAALGEGRLPEASGAIIAGPAIAGGDFVSPPARALAWTLAGMLPDKRWTGEGFVSFRASDNIEALRAMSLDPLYLKAPSAREIFGLIRIMDRAAEAAPHVAKPLLVLIGAHDELVDPDDVRAVAATIPPPVDVRTYPDGWHLLFRDLHRAQVWVDVRDWILARPDPAQTQSAQSGAWGTTSSRAAAIGLPQATQ